MGQIGLIIIFTIAVFFFLAGRFLFKYLSKFYIIETKRIIGYFKEGDRNYGEFLLTLLISIFTGVLAFIVYKTIMVLVAYAASTDLIDFFIKNRGVFASSRVDMQDPSLWVNIIYGLILTPLVQFLSIFLMIKFIQIFMNEFNRRAMDEIYSASSLVYFSTISLIVFVVIELFAYSQSITFVNTITNIVLLIGAKLGYVLFFYSILHIELIKNISYKTALHNDWSFNTIEKKLVSNNLVLLITSLVISIVLNLPLYSGFQFESNNWTLLGKLVLVAGFFYIILMKTFAKGFDYIGVYMIDDTRIERIPTLKLFENNFKKIILFGILSLALILVVYNIKGLFFISFYMVVVYLLSIGTAYLIYIIGWKIKKSNYKKNYIKAILFSFGKALIPALMFMLFAFTLLNINPKKVDPSKYSHYQKTIVDPKGNVLYFESSKFENPSSPINYEELPEFFIKALIAQEDRGFFNQNSWFFNKRNWHGISSTGRSNIDQQLIKNWAFKSSFPQEMQRKFSEFIASYQLSINQSPKTILTHYINNVSFNGGSGHKGIVNASYYTFGGNITNINELEMMYLVVTLHRGSDFKINSEKYIPYKEAQSHPDEIKERLIFFAKSWLEDNLITKKEFKRLKKQHLNFTNKSIRLNNLASTNIFFSKSLKNLKEEFITSESSITLENQLKVKLAVDRFNEKFRNQLIKEGNQLYTAALVVDVKTGNILSHYGGEGVSDMSKFGEGNPIGSIIKPFVLLELLEQGHQIRLYDGKRKGKRLIHNYNRICSNKYLNEVGILKSSKNTPMGNIYEVTEPIPLFLEVEAKFSQMNIRVDSAIDLNDKDKKLENTLNYPIGSRRMTIYDIAQSYQTLFNDGKFLKLSVLNKSFNPYELKDNVFKKNSITIYNKRNVNIITNALKTVLEVGGTAYSLNKYLPKNVQFMAKTGTTDEFRHGYTILCDGETLVVSWVSYGKEVNGVLRFNQTAIPNRSGGSSAGILAAYIFDELYKD